MAVFPNIHNPDQIRRKNATDKLRLGDSLRDAQPVLFKTLKVIKNKKKSTEKLTHHRSLGRHENLISCGILNWILE